MARSGLAVPGARAARPHRRDPGARVPRRRRARRALRARRPRARARAGRALPRRAAGRGARDRSAPRRADPAAFLPVAYRDLDELDGFLEHLAREVHDPGYSRAARRLLGDAALRAEWRRAPCTRGGHHAYLGGLLEHTVAVGDARARGVPAAPAAELRPADLPPRSCTTSARRASSPTAPRSGSPTRAGCSATSCSASSCSRRAWAALDAERRLALAALRAQPPRRRRGARAALRLARGARAVPAQRARRERQGRARARPHRFVTHRRAVRATLPGQSETRRQG